MAWVTGPRRTNSTKGVEGLLEVGSKIGLSEVELLDRFVQRRDEAAFAVLVDRHGPLVLGVCRRYLRDANDVDDAFQAVFLILARKAGSLRNKGLLTNWLYGVSCRVAARARSVSIRRSERATVDDGERLDVDVRRPTGEHPSEALARDEERITLHEEVRRLPDRYRAPVVACYFEGRTHEEAATLLGCPVGTVKGRLSRARDLLRNRLERQGVTASAVGLTTALAAPDLRAEVLPSLAAKAVANALAPSSSAFWMTTTTAIPTSVGTLAQGVIQTMFLTQLRTLALPAAIVTAGLVTTGASLVVGQDEAVKATTPAPAVKPSDANASQGDDAATSIENAAQEPSLQPSAKSAIRRRMDEDLGQMMGGGDMGGMGGGMMGRMVFGPDGARYPTQFPIARLAALLQSFDSGDDNEPIYEALAQRITLKSDGESTLGNLLAQIRSEVQMPGGKTIPVFIDMNSLNESNKSLDESVEIDLPNVPLKTSLRLLLKSCGLAYCVRDGVLIISTQDGIHLELLEAQEELIGREPSRYQLGRDGVIQLYEDGMGGGGMMSGGMGGGMR